MVIAHRYAIVKKIVERTVGDAGSTQGCRVTVADFPRGKVEGRKWLLKAIDAMERRTDQ
jgi:hypothetical protein